MHDEAYAFVKKVAESVRLRRRVLEMGSCNVNGSVRSLFTSADYYLGIDQRPGLGVDVVADAADWRPQHAVFDTVVCTEMLEHTPSGMAICRTAFDVLGAGGLFIVTAATNPREPHSIDGEPVLGENEYYKNVSSAELVAWLDPFAFWMIDMTTNPGDIYAIAVKG